MKSFKILFFTTMITGSMITISSNSWMGMWIGLEINLLSIIPLLSANDQDNSTEASIKYFITQTIASNIILMAIICMFYNNEQINNHFNLTLMIQSALCIKMGAAPFHSWFPEVMEGLHWLNCLIMLTWQKIAPMIMMMLMIKQEMFIYMTILMSSAIGSIIGFNQISLKKIMAYSSINHIGWMIAAMISTKSIWLIYFSIYSIITVNVIWIFHYMNAIKISQIPSLFLQKKISGLIFSMNFFSLGGLPPFLGFLPKWLTIQQLIFMENYALAIIMIMLTLIAMFFYLRLSIIPLTLVNQTNLVKYSKNLNFMVYFTNTTSLTALAMISLLMNPF
uniref:NADH dehydrogenase subunit 2 n=1 Tax=Cryptocephalus dimidiatipennis TaxID=2978450 RepID=UPI0021CC96B8|nr:NADH dehydrogenase subunit 2 [Cryptocephalus dimidiatipennis]UWV18197.1 NADH dehydrogenase subunit 2 [Cryptocephalus dimidiatipennis]